MVENKTILGHGWSPAVTVASCSAY